MTRIDTTQHDEGKGTLLESVIAVKWFVFFSRILLIYTDHSYNIQVQFNQLNLVSVLSAIALTMWVRIFGGDFGAGHPSHTVVYGTSTNTTYNGSDLIPYICCY